MAVWHINWRPKNHNPGTIQLDSGISLLFFHLSFWTRKTPLSCYFTESMKFRRENLFLVFSEVTSQAVDFYFPISKSHSALSERDLSRPGLNPLKEVGLMCSQARLGVSVDPDPSLRAHCTHVPKLPSLCSLCTSSNCMAWGERNPRGPQWFWKGQSVGRGARRAVEDSAKGGGYVIKTTDHSKEGYPCTWSTSIVCAKMFLSDLSSKTAGKRLKAFRRGREGGFGLLAYYKKAHL